MHHKIFENKYFLAQLVSEDQLIWEVIRKIPTLPGANGELLEIVGPCCTSDNTYFIFDLNDFELAKELTHLGIHRVGYLQEEPLGLIKIDGSSGTWNASITKIEDIENRKSISKNFFKLDELNHDLMMPHDLFVDSIFRRDRIFWGITKTTYNVENLGERAYTKGYLTPKSTDSWNEILQERKSADIFQAQFRLKTTDLLSFLENSWSRRKDEHLTYASPGGFNILRPYLAIRHLEGYADGIYSFNTDTKSLELLFRYSHFQLLEQFLFLPASQAGATVLIFMTVTFEELFPKYGQRSLRFSLLTVGAALHQAHLVAHSQGLKYRIIGGFDETQLNSILQLKENEHLLCCAALGG